MLSPLNIFDRFRSDAKALLDTSVRSLALKELLGEGMNYFSANKNKAFYGINFANYMQYMQLLVDNHDNDSHILRIIEQSMQFTPEELDRLKRDVASSGKILSSEGILCDFFNENLSKCVVLDFCFNKTVCSFLPFYGNEIGKGIVRALSDGYLGIRQYICSHYHVKNEKVLNDFMSHVGRENSNVSTLGNGVLSLSELFNLWILEQDCSARRAFATEYCKYPHLSQIPMIQLMLADGIHSLLPRYFKELVVYMTAHDGNYRGFIKFHGIVLEPEVADFCEIVFHIGRSFPSIQKDVEFCGMLTAHNELVRQAPVSAVIWHDEGAPKLFANRAILSDKHIGLLAQDEFLKMSIVWGLFKKESEAVLRFLIENNQWSKVRKLANSPNFTLP
jgi:hypothetical protein